MRFAIFALGVLAFIGVAGASVPDPAMCDVQPWDGMDFPRGRGIPVTGGSADGDVTVTVNANIGGLPTPIVGAYVEVSFRADCVLFICADSGHTGYTGAGGVVELNVGVGGCCEGGASVVVEAGDDTVVPPAMTVIRAYEWFVSTDSNASGSTTLGDFAAFGASFGACDDYCSDYNGDGCTTLGDFALFGGNFGSACE